MARCAVVARRSAGSSERPTVYLASTYGRLRHNSSTSTSTIPSPLPLNLWRHDA